MKRLLAAVLFMTAFNSVCCAEQTVDSIIDAMEAADKGITSLQFDFKQEIAYSLTNEKQSNNGSVTYLKPENIFVRQNGPLQQEITSNGKKVWIYTPKYKQVVADKWKKWASGSFLPSSILNFGQGYKDLKKRYVITYEGRKDDKYVLLFKPAGKNEFAMRFWIDAASFIPDKIVITGENVVITTEVFNRTLNPKVDKKLFTFQAPAGVEVLDLP